jgi:addiction module HigA family antidote
MELSQRDLADSIGVPYQRINEIINGRRGTTASTALRLAHFFDMSSGFWLNLQARWISTIPRVRKPRFSRGSRSIDQRTNRQHAAERGVLTVR